MGKAAVPAVPVVKYMDPHHTEGMTKQGVPEDTDSVKLAKEQHKFAQHVQKVNKVQYVAPYTTYAGYPYVHHPVATHFIAKREAEAEADPAVFYNAYNGVYSPYLSTYSAYPYTTAVAGYPYNKVYTTGYTGYTYNTPVVHALGKREAEADRMPLFTTELTDTTTDLHTPTTTVPHTLTEPTHTETFTEPGTEPLRRT